MKYEGTYEVKDKCDLDFVVASKQGGQVERLTRIVNGVWNKIPKDDQASIQKYVLEESVRRLVIVVDNEWPHSNNTNSILTTPQCIIVIDGGYVDAADSEHVSATIAYMLANLRGWASDRISGESSNLAYATSNEWGFRLTDVIFKCEACRYADSVLWNAGVGGQFFWDEVWKTFIFLPDGERLQLRDNNVIWLNDNPWASLEWLLSGDFECGMLFQEIGDYPNECANLVQKRNEAWSEFENMLQKRKESWGELEKSEQCKKWKEDLTEITERTMPEDNW